ncbi:hypothetical protein [Nocardia sp. XZ_19_369]|uniref:hypothetical protein n=1 Tax=Nocardia sp. XZ_19_369 TaxID=2769487 RepID=UPI00188FEE5E|nr:hypothetical protein [Nocardia sp. XZ_19_369]
MRRKDDPTAAARKFARDLAVAIVASLIVAGLTRMTDAWPQVVAKCDNNAWAAGGALVVLLTATFWSWWFIVTLVLTVFSGPPSKLEGGARIVDDVGAAIVCLVAAVIPIGLTSLLWLFVFGTW